MCRSPALRRRAAGAPPGCHRDSGRPIDGSRAELKLTLNQVQLAARLGTVRELVARALSQLRKSGVIASTGGRVVSRDRMRLTE
ncbi:MAG: winged helix-turn-helix domain-containing protein, partial [Candidatus Rokubacteria bacterium]|nr:winged helix-turn-helix domain-containing protein [Candidatus Rokubacteria bacterium]